MKILGRAAALPGPKGAPPLIQIICTKTQYHGINVASTLIAVELRSNKPIIKLGTLNFKKWLKFALKFSPKNAMQYTFIATWHGKGYI
jgi:hypothetical protein